MSLCQDVYLANSAMQTIIFFTNIHIGLKYTSPWISNGIFLLIYASLTEKEKHRINPKSQGVVKSDYGSNSGWNIGFLLCGGQTTHKSKVQAGSRL